MQKNSAVLWGGVYTCLAMNDFDRLITNLRWLMANAKLSNQTKLARASGVSQTHISNILGRRNYPTVEVIQKIAAAYKLATWQLLAPLEMLQKGVDTGLPEVIANFLVTDDQGKATILEVAAGQAKYRPGGPKIPVE